jgi:WD40 repeat protein
MVLATGPATAAPLSQNALSLPETLRGILKTKKTRLTSAWGGYGLRLGGPVLAISSDGRRGLTGGEDRSLRLWDLASGQQRRIYSGLSESATCAAFSRDGRLVAAGTRDGTVMIFEAESARPLHPLRRHQGEVASVAFSPDGKLVASGGEDARVRVWEVARARALHQLTGHTDWVREVAFFDDGKSVASASDDGTWRVWELTRGKLLKTLGELNGPEVTALALSHDGKLALTGEAGRGVRLWSVDAGEPLRMLDEAARVVAVAFSEGGARGLAIGSNRREPYVLGVKPAPGAAEMWLHQWDLATGGALSGLKKPDEGLEAAAFSAGGKLALTSELGNVRVWDVASHRQLAATGGHTAAIQALAFSPDGRLALSAARDGTARIWEVGRGKESRRLGGFTQNVIGVAFSADGKLALAADVYGMIRLFDVATGVEVSRFGPHRGLIALTITRDGKQIATASYERVSLWDAASGREVIASRLNKLISMIAFSPDGLLALTAGSTDGPQLREISSGRILQSFQRPNRVTLAVALSPRGSVAAVATSGSGRARDSLDLWDMQTGKRLESIPARVGGLNALAFSSDGQLLITAGRDGAIGLFSLRLRREIDRMDLGGNNEIPTAFAFGPDGLSFLAGTSLGALQHYLLTGNPMKE